MRKFRGFLRNGIWQAQFGFGTLFATLALLLIRFDGPGPVKNLWLTSGVFLVGWSLLKGWIGTLAPEMHNVAEALRKQKGKDGSAYYVIDWYSDEHVRVPTLLVFSKRWVGIGACLIAIVTCFSSCRAFNTWIDYDATATRTNPPFASPFFVVLPTSEVACTVMHDAKPVPGSGLSLVIVEMRSNGGSPRHEGLFVSAEKQMLKGEVHRCKYVEHFDWKKQFFTNEPPYQSIERGTTIVLDEEN